MPVGSNHIFSLTIPYLNSCSFGNQLAISGNEDMKILEKYEGVIWNLIFFFYYNKWFKQSNDYYWPCTSLLFTKF